MLDLAALTADDFRPHAGTAFRVRAPLPEPIDLELAVVEEVSKARPGTRQPFALVFLGPPSDRYLNQGAIPLMHPVMGQLDLFLVPLGPTPERRMQYEAVFA